MVPSPSRTEGPVLRPAGPVLRPAIRSGSDGRLCSAPNVPGRPINSRTENRNQFARRWRPSAPQSRFISCQRSHRRISSMAVARRPMKGRVFGGPPQTWLRTASRGGGLKPVQHRWQLGCPSDVRECKHSAVAVRGSAWFARSYFHPDNSVLITHHLLMSAPTDFLPVLTDHLPNLTC